MDGKKRLLSVAILLAILGTETAYAARNPYYPSELETVEANDEDSITSLIEESKRDADPYITYNRDLEESGKLLNDEDIAYLASLSEYQDIVGISSTLGWYDVIDVGENGALVVREEGKRPRVVDKDPMGDYYYDILTWGLLSEGMVGVDLNDTMSFSDFVKYYDIQITGYCLSSFWKCEASEEALKTISEVYGKEVAEVIREKGLPIPFYSYQDIYDACSYDYMDNQRLRK